MMPLEPVFFMLFFVDDQRRFLAKPLGEWQIAECQPEA